MSTPSQFIARFRLPAANTRALGVLALFVAAQIADAWLTAAGVERFGIAAEANPMLSLSILVFGPAAALIVAKGLALAGATVLYRLSRHTLLATLTAAYVFVAIMPWALALGMA